MNENPNDIYNCLSSYDTMCQGDIIFVNNKVPDCAYFGDLNATIALSKGVQGTIVNGCTRDIQRLTHLKYPVYYKKNTCNDIKNIGTLDFYNKSIEI